MDVSDPSRFTAEKSPGNHFIEVGVPQRQCGRYGEEKNLISAGNRTKFVKPITRRYTTELSVLHVLSASESNLARN
jgi:hypothetical protein